MVTMSWLENYALNVTHCEWKCYFPCDTYKHIHTPPSAIDTHSENRFRVYLSHIFQAPVHVCTHHHHVYVNVRFSFLSIRGIPFCLCAFHLSLHPFCCLAPLWSGMNFPPSCFTCIARGAHVFVHLCSRIRENQTRSYHIFIKISGSSSVSQTNLWMKHTNFQHTLFVCFKSSNRRVSTTSNERTNAQLLMSSSQ